MKNVLIIQNRFKSVEEAYEYSPYNLKFILHRYRHILKREEIEEFCHWLTLGEYDISASLLSTDGNITINIVDILEPFKLEEESERVR